MDPLLELNQKTGKLKKPPLKIIIIHVMRTSLNGNGTHPHKLKLRKKLCKKKSWRVLARAYFDRIFDKLDAVMPR
jgi:hypothetical protein